MRQKYNSNGLFKTAAALMIIAAAFIKSTSLSPVKKAEPAQNIFEKDTYTKNESINVFDYAQDCPHESTLFLGEDKEENTKTDVSTFGENDIKVLNNTSLKPDYWTLLNSQLDFSSVENGEPSVLIIHTHASEAYTPSEKYPYEATDPSRTEDTRYNMVRVGEEIAAGLIKAGIGVYHERELFDYPSYNGSYTRALARINELLSEYPTIQFVLDIHRDALITADGCEYAGTCKINGEDSAEILIVSGTGEGGLAHPAWEENLKFALQLERMMEVKYEGLLRNLNLRNERFNQHATKGSLIIEVGCTGNTLEQALGAARAFSECAGEVILEAISKKPD